MICNYFILFSCSEKISLHVNRHQRSWFIWNPLKMLLQIQRTLLQTWPPLCFWHYHQQNGYYGYSSQTLSSECTTRSSITVFMYGSCSPDLFPVPSMGKLLMTLAILDQKKVLLLIQTYIRWQALPQWYQCLWAAVSKVMSCQSFTKICICVSSEEIMWFFSCWMTMLNYYCCLLSVKIYWNDSKVGKVYSIFSCHNSTRIYC